MAVLAIKHPRVYDGNHVLQLKEICSHLADDMAREGLRGKTLTLKLKSAATFEVRRPSYKYHNRVPYELSIGFRNISTPRPAQHSKASYYSFQL